MKIIRLLSFKLIGVKLLEFLRLYTFVDEPTEHSHARIRTTPFRIYSICEICLIVINFAAENKWEKESKRDGKSERAAVKSILPSSPRLCVAFSRNICRLVNFIAELSTTEGAFCRQMTDWLCASKTDLFGFFCVFWVGYVRATFTSFFLSYFCFYFFCYRWFQNCCWFVLWQPFD